jgi:hypothetical protein
VRVGLCAPQGCRRSACHTTVAHPTICRHFDHPNGYRNRNRRAPVVTRESLPVGRAGNGNARPQNGSVYAACPRGCGRQAGNHLRRPGVVGRGKTIRNVEGCGWTCSSYRNWPRVIRGPFFGVAVLSAWPSGFARRSM